jgi:hypothetical protein
MRDNAEDEYVMSTFFDKLLFRQFNIMIKGKFEQFNGENRMRYFAVKVLPYNMQSENKALLRRLELYKHVQPIN